MKMLIDDHNSTATDDIERLWTVEIERRITQLDEGQAKLIPGDEVFAMLRNKYAK